MKIKLDENLPTELGELLARLGHNVDSVRDEGLEGRPDVTIFETAQREGRFLITQDLDFSDSHRFLPGSHAGILLVRLREPTRRALLEHLSHAIQRADLQQWERCLVVLSEIRIRIRRPTP